MNEWVGFPAVGLYKGLDLKNVPLNSATVFANTSLNIIGVYVLEDGCGKCPYTRLQQLRANKEVSWTVDTSVSTTWRILNNGDQETIPWKHKQGLLCETRPTFKEFGVYRLDVGRCETMTEVPPVDSYLPLLLFVLLLFGSLITYKLVKYFIARAKTATPRRKRGEEPISLDLEVTNVGSAVDFFRGILVLFIIFTTTGGGEYPVFNRTFGGLSIADYLFASLLWSVGVKIPTDVDREYLDGSRKCSLIWNVTKKSFLLILIGLLIHVTVSSGTTSWATLWIPFLRIGAGYLFAASLYTLTVQKCETNFKKLIGKALENFMALVWCWVAGVLFLAVFISMIVTFASYDCFGIFGPLKDIPDVENSKRCNYEDYVLMNKIFLASSKSRHIDTFYGFSRGLLGILTAILQTMLGLKSGHIYLSQKSISDKLKLMLLWTGIFGLVGIVFLNVSFVVTVNLWPIATIILIAAVSSLVFSITYLITEVWMNSSSIISSVGATFLVLLAGHQFFSTSSPLNLDFLDVNNHFAQLMKSFWIVCVWIVLGTLCFKKNILMFRI